MYTSEVFREMQIGRRIHVEQTGDEIHIVIGPDRHWLAQVATVISVAVFCLIPAVVFAAAYLADDGPTGAALAFVLVFEIVAIAVFVSIVYDALWKLFGFEEFTLKDGELEIATVLFSHRRVRAFSVDQIANLRYEERASRHSARRTIFFDYRGKEVASGRQLTREEGRSLIRGPLSGLTGRRSGVPPIVEI